MEHTQSPWKLFVSNDAKPHNVFFGVDVGSIAIHHYGFVDKDGAISRQQLANARLIAAAPELLEALQEVVRVFESNPPSISDTVWVTGNSPETLYDHCRAAIAKATGLQNDL